MAIYSIYHTPFVIITVILGITAGILTERVSRKFSNWWCKVAFGGMFYVIFGIFGSFPRLFEAPLQCLGQFFKSTIFGVKELATFEQPVGSFNGLLVPLFMLIFATTILAKRFLKVSLVVFVVVINSFCAQEYLPEIIPLGERFAISAEPTLVTPPAVSPIDDYRTFFGARSGSVLMRIDNASANWINFARFSDYDGVHFRSDADFRLSSGSISANDMPLNSVEISLVDYDYARLPFRHVRSYHIIA